jgi:glyceraldehyde 3-phosphate dehydrogenase
MAIRVAINGFGRIGRQVFKILHQRYPEELQITHIGVSNPHATETRALLLQHDSNYGLFEAEVQVDVRRGNNLIVIEASGHFRGRNHLHLTGGARRVIVTAPDSRADVTVVVGINHHNYDPKEHRIVSNASCTTNGLAPMAKVLHDTAGIREGLMTTIHAYTGSQPVLDHVSGDPRRSRSAATNIVPTTTGAAKAVSEVIPELAGRLNGCAYRVPIPTVSIVELFALVARPASAAAINAAFEEASKAPPLEGILGYSDLPLVSTDFQGTTYSSVIDALSTTCMENTVKVAAWYDNEWGYACRVAELAHYLLERGF